MRGRAAGGMPLAPMRHGPLQYGHGADGVIYTSAEEANPNAVFERRTQTHAASIRVSVYIASVCMWSCVWGQVSTCSCV